MTFEAELSATKRELDIAVIEIEDYKKKMAEQSETLKEYEVRMKNVEWFQKYCYLHNNIVVKLLNIFMCRTVSKNQSV